MDIRNPLVDSTAGNFGSTQHRFELGFGQAAASGCNRLAGNRRFSATMALATMVTCMLSPLVVHAMLGHWPKSAEDAELSP